MALALRPYQHEAVEATVGVLKPGGRAQTHLACGAGKSIIAVECAERLAQQSPGPHLVVVFVPSLALVKQTLEVWGAHARRAWAQFAVCSDETVIDRLVNAEDLGVPVSTDPQAIADFLGQRPATLVLCTYASAPRLAKALRIAGRTASLAVYDEGHHLAGRSAAVDHGILDDSVLPARARLFMTATPVLQGDDDEQLTMDDEGVFGPVAYTYPFGRGIDEGYLSDYRLAVVGITSAEARAMLERTDVDLVEGVGSPDIRMVAAQAALMRAYEKWGAKRAVAFCPTIKASTDFARTFAQTLARVKGPRPPEPRALMVSGEQSALQRTMALEALADPPPGSWTVLANARVLSEGVDIPAIDTVIFAHAKKSVVDIVQAVGRALRRHPDKTGPSTIILPIIVPEADELVSSLDPREYAVLWDVVRALRAHDAALGAELDRLRMAGPEGIEDGELPERIVLHLPPGTTASLVSELKVMLVEQVTSSWRVGFGASLEYKAKTGDINAPQRYISPAGMRVGTWQNNQRFRMKRGVMPHEERELLEAEGFEWNPAEANTARYLDAARAFHAEHGNLDCGNRHVTEDGLGLGSWLGKQRPAMLAGTIDPEISAVLSELGFSADPRTQLLETGLRELTAFHAANGHGFVPSRLVTESGFGLGVWVGQQRTKRQTGKLTPEVIARMDAAGMEWSAAARTRAQLLDRGLGELAAYRDANGHGLVPSGYVTASGFELAVWVDQQRVKHRDGKLTPEIVARMEAAGMRWTGMARIAEQLAQIEAARSYHAEHGTLLAPKKLEYNGVFLGPWLRRQAAYRTQGRIDPLIEAELDKLGMPWDEMAAAATTGMRKAEPRTRARRTSAGPDPAEQVITPEAIAAFRKLVAAATPRQHKARASAPVREAASARGAMLLEWTGKGIAVNRIAELTGYSHAGITGWLSAARAELRGADRPG